MEAQFYLKVHYDPTPNADGDELANLRECKLNKKYGHISPTRSYGDSGEMCRNAVGHLASA